jgi:uncharacterized membrane protein YhhN
MKPFNVFFIGAVIFALLDWMSAWKGWRIRLYIAKPATLALLALWTWTVTGWQDGFIWFGIGLLFALLGDVFLMLSPKFFLPGMAAFFVMQVSYLIGFNQEPLEFTLPIAFAAICVGLVASEVLRVIRPGISATVKSKRFLIPYIVYFASLTLMLLSTILCLFRPEWTQSSAWMAAAGGMLFFASDSLLSFDRFVKRIPHARFWVHLTYHLGQLGIITGVVLHYAGRLN